MWSQRSWWDRHIHQARCVGPGTSESSAGCCDPLPQLGLTQYGLIYGAVEFIVTPDWPCAPKWTRSPHFLG